MDYSLTVSAIDAPENKRVGDNIGSSDFGDNFNALC